jgi:hypothetical protein
MQNDSNGFAKNKLSWPYGDLSFIASFLYSKMATDIS